MDTLASFVKSASKTRPAMPTRCYHCTWISWSGICGSPFSPFRKWPA